MPAILIQLAATHDGEVRVTLFFVASDFVGAAGAAGFPIIFSVIVSVPLVFDGVSVMSAALAGTLASGRAEVSIDSTSAQLIVFLNFIFTPLVNLL